MTTPAGHPADDLAHALLDLHLATEAEGVLRRCAQLARRALGAPGVSILVLDSRLSEESVVTSGESPVAHLLESAEEGGPAWTAAQELTTVHVSDLHADDRWPRWSSAAVDRGARAVLSVGLSTPGRRTGALTVFSDRAGRFTRSEVRTVERIAEHLSAALAWHRKIDDRDDIIETRRMIGVATGLLMARYDVTDDRAFELMRRHSHAHHVKVREVARHVVEHRELPGGRHSR